MEDFDLGKALREYRISKGETFESMADLTLMCRAKYARLENNQVRLTVEEKYEIAARVPGLVIPKKNPLGEALRTLIWFFPLVLAFFFFLVMDMESFKEAYGGEKHLEEDPIHVVFAIMIVIATTIAWWYIHPKYWFTRQQAMAWFRKMRRARISWFKITYKEEKKDIVQKKKDVVGKKKGVKEKDKVKTEVKKNDKEPEMM